MFANSLFLTKNSMFDNVLIFIILKMFAKVLMFAYYLLIAYKG